MLWVWGGAVVSGLVFSVCRFPIFFLVLASAILLSALAAAGLGYPCGATTIAVGVGLQLGYVTGLAMRSLHGGFFLTSCMAFPQLGGYSGRLET